MSTDLAYSEWIRFLSKLEAAEEEFVSGRPPRSKLFGPKTMMVPCAAPLVVWHEDGAT